MYAVAISPDGKTLATAGSDKIIHLWNPDTLKQKLPLEGHAGPVYGLSFNHKSDRLASAGWDGTVRVWDSANGKLLHSWEGHSGDIWSIAFSPTGSKLATGRQDGAVKTWDAESGKLLGTYPRQPFMPSPSIETANCLPPADGTAPPGSGGSSRVADAASVGDVT